MPSAFMGLSSSTPRHQLRQDQFVLRSNLSASAGRVQSATSKSTELYAQFMDVGTKMGLSGGELARFVSESVRAEQQLELERQTRAEERRAQYEREERRERMMMEEQREREAKLIEALQSANASFANASTAATPATPTDSYRVKNLPFKEGDDIDAYLQHFERVATTHKWKPEVWAARLVPLLEGSARDAYLRMNPDSAGNYEELKKTLLERFHRTSEYYRRKFRAVKKDSKETFVQFLHRLQTLMKRWFQMASKDIEKAEDVVDVMLMEQFMNTLTPELEQHVRGKWPASAGEAALIAHRHLEAKLATRKPFDSKSVPRPQDENKPADD
jgi:hypothetical protein